MILVLDPSLDENNQNALCLKLQKQGYFTRLVNQFGSLLIALDGPGEEALVAQVGKWSGVKEVVTGKNPYFLASRKCHKKNSLIKVGRGKNSAIIGAGNFVAIAGPCAIETQEASLSLAHKVKEAGARIFRGMIFKPRSSPYAFQGLGRAGIPILHKIKEQTGLLILSEVRDALEAELLQDVVDLIQVGTRNMSNFQLLKHLGQIKKPVVLKRGMGASIEELLAAAEYIIAHGNPEVILCERGIRTFEQYTRFSFDIGAIPAIKELSHLPVIADPSHASGKSSLVEPLALAAVAAGAHGIMLEVHESPATAFSDGTQSIEPDKFLQIMKKVAPICAAIS
jgi:3-deoxy-7-phosphoheptulonate synthase